MVESVLGSIVIGALAGYIAGKLRRGKSLGLLLNILIGLVGGVLGGYLLNLIGIYNGGSFLARLATSTLGAIVLLLLADVLSKKR